MEIDTVMLEAGGTALTADHIAMYRMAAEIVNSTVGAVMALCRPGAAVAQLCQYGDVRLHEQLGAVYNHGQIEKGMAYPTTVCVNACVDNFSPAPEDDIVLAEGDVAKVSLGVHIDGHVVMGTQTVLVGAAMAQTGPVADAVCAATVAAEAVLRLLRPGTKSDTITAAIEAAAAQFGVHPVQEVAVVNTQRFVRVGRKQALNASRPEDEDEAPFEVAASEAYHVNIAMSTGTGQIHVGTPRPTIYERNMEIAYQLKLKAARSVYADVSERFPTMPFPLRELDPKHGAFGMKECVTHGLIKELAPRFVKSGEIAVGVQFTVLVTEGKTVQLNGFAPPHVQSEYSVTDPTLQQLLALNPKTGVSTLA